MFYLILMVKRILCGHVFLAVQIDQLNESHHTNHKWKKNQRKMWRLMMREHHLTGIRFCGASDLKIDTQIIHFYFNLTSAPVLHSNLAHWFHWINNRLVTVIRFFIPNLWKTSNFFLFSVQNIDKWFHQYFGQIIIYFEWKNKKKLNGFIEFGRFSNRPCLTFATCNCSKFWSPVVLNYE